MNQTKQCDALVIGAGAAGAIVADTLSAHGCRVIVLEAGRRLDYAKDFVTYDPDYQVKGRTVFAMKDPRNERLTIRGERGFQVTRVRAVGGGTLHYAMNSDRFHPRDFRLRSLTGQGQDWPIAYEDLEPYYDRVENDLGVAGLAGSPWEAPRRPYPNPPHPLAPAARLVAEGCHRLGIRTWVIPYSALSRPRDGRPACIYCGRCSIGCQIGAKSSVDLVYVKRAEATGRVTILANSNVVRIEVDSRGKAVGAVYGDSDSAQHRVKADVVILSGGAIESPRLLLNSSGPPFPEGVANRNGLVGKYFMTHVNGGAGGFLTSPMPAGLGLGATTQDFRRTDEKRGYVGGWTGHFAGGLGPVSLAKYLMELGSAGWGNSHMELMKQYFGRYVQIGCDGEMLPRQENCVDLDPDVRDGLGLPVARINITVSENERNVLKHMNDACSAILESAGCTQVLANGLILGSDGHYMGTCRMGKDPATSVVDAWCRTHDVPNLFVVDGGCFVSSPAMGPTLSIQALALRAAEYIAAEAKRL